MAIEADKLAAQIRALPEEDKLRLLEVILTDLDRPDPTIDHIWAVEARKRWNAYKTGEIDSVSYEDLMKRYQR